MAGQSFIESWKLRLFVQSTKQKGDSSGVEYMTDVFPWLPSININLFVPIFSLL